MKDAWDYEDHEKDFIIWSNKMAPDTAYKVHQDSIWKRLSLVVYIGKDNAGTLFHKSENDGTYARRSRMETQPRFAFVP